mmetsp:Transcript_9199/g.8580  ORF Transcript_9199/g.8580 Transcript_9199/m.8580 type:complete len:108 (+) Transcript_9199:88-411(+)
MKANQKVQNYLQHIQEDDYSKLKVQNEKLRSIKRAFRKYFSEKREAFPRFFLLSDSQLMNLLCSQNSPHLMNSYLRYCFKGVKEMILNEKKDMIMGCIGIKNEIVYL